MENSFFAGLESFMEDDKTVEASATVTVTPEEHEEEVAEAEGAASEQEETTAEIDQQTQAAEMVFAKFEEIDRMIAHVETYGVDRSFLSICNHDNVLGNSFGIVLPSCESFDAVGDPYSATSMAALEGFRDAARKVWEFIKRMIARIGDWIVRIVKMYDVRIKLVERSIKRVKATLAMATGFEKNYSAENKTDGKVISLAGLQDYQRALTQQFEVMQTPGDEVTGVMKKVTLTKSVEKKPKMPEARVEIKSLKFADVNGYVKFAEQGIELAKKYLVKVADRRKTVSALNAKVAAAEREDKKDEAKALQSQVTAFSNSVSLMNRSIGGMISASSKAIGTAAKVLKATKKSDKKD